MAHEDLSASKVAQLYEKAKNWIFYVCVVLIVILSYFGDFLGELKNILLPAAVVSVIVIIFETLQKVEKNLSALYQSENRDFASIHEALPTISSLVSHDVEVTTVDIIASTGGTTVANVIPNILRSSSAQRVEIRIHLLDPATPVMEHCPKHWSNETRLVIDRIKDQLRQDRLGVKVYLYDHLPTIHGIMINKQYLFLGFFGWKRDMFGKNELGGSLRPHRLYNKTKSDSTFFFELFEDWLNYDSSRLEYEFPQVT